jgi:excisionase family DNA binding protein
MKVRKYERVLRVAEFARATGYKVSTIRKKLFRREIAYFKVGRPILIPESEVTRLLGRLNEPVKVK